MAGTYGTQSAVWFECLRRYPSQVKSCVPRLAGIHQRPVPRVVTPEANPLTVDTERDQATLATRLVATSRRFSRDATGRPPGLAVGTRVTSSCSRSFQATALVGSGECGHHGGMTERGLRESYQAILSAVAAADLDALDRLIDVDITDHCGDQAVAAATASSTG